MNEANKTISVEAYLPITAFDQARYRLAMRVVWMTGIFSLFVAGLLWVSYSQRLDSDLVNSLELQQLKTKLLETPKDDQLLETIREKDLQLRNHFFQRRDFFDHGKYLLLAGIVLFFIGSKIAVNLKQALPMPQASGQVNLESQLKLPRYGVSLLGVLLFGAALWLMLQSGVKPAFENNPTPLVETDVEAAPTVAVAQTFATLEEIERNWPCFRGPGGLGVAHYTNIPKTFNGQTGENIVWKTPIPLPGHSSPVIWNDQIFLTGADKENQAVYCLSAKDGKLQWQTPVALSPQSKAKPPKIMEMTGYAAPTCVIDGQRVYAIFAAGDLAALDFSGQIVWKKSFGVPDNVYGHSTSLMMYQDRLIIQFDQSSPKKGKSKLVAINGATGQIVWQKQRFVSDSWATPINIKTPKGDQIITCSTPWVIAYDPLSGDEIWKVDCLGADVAASPIYANGFVFVTDSNMSVMAIKPDGQGDVTATHIAWSVDEGIPEMCSPVSNGKFIYLLTYGLLTCYQTSDGVKVWEREFDSNFLASPTLIGELIYLLDEEGNLFVVSTTQQEEEVMTGSLGEPSGCSPAIVDGRMYLRGEKYLYCIGEGGVK